jgi:hypothetical protein
MLRYIITRDCGSWSIKLSWCVSGPAYYAVFPGVLQNLHCVSWSITLCFVEYYTVFPGVLHCASWSITLCFQDYYVDDILCFPGALIFREV